jgi:hypothetical protein
VLPDATAPVALSTLHNAASPTAAAAPAALPTATTAPAASPAAATVPHILDETGNITQETVQTCSQKDSWVLHCSNPEDHKPTDDSPSRYLQMSCPPCYAAIMAAVFTRCSQLNFWNAAVG